MSIDLNAIKARADAATPARWGYSLFGVTHTGFVIQEHASSGLLDDGEMVKADLEFIAHAREDVPALVAEIERLREIINAQKARPDARRLAMSLRSTRHAEKGWRRSYEKQRAENDRLRSELADARGFTLKDGAE